MLTNEPNKFKQENFPPIIDFEEREHLLREATIYFVNIKSILQDLDHSKNYKKETHAIQKKNLRNTHIRSLRKLFTEFSDFDYIIKIQEGNILNARTEILFKQLHRVVLHFEKMPTRYFNYQKVLRELLDPILEHLRNTGTLTSVNLNDVELPKREEET